jgi:hypothetical protein
VLDILGVRVVRELAVRRRDRGGDLPAGLLEIGRQPFDRHRQLPDLADHLAAAVLADVGEGVEPVEPRDLLPALLGERVEPAAHRLHVEAPVRDRIVVPAGRDDDEARARRTRAGAVAERDLELVVRDVRQVGPEDRAYLIGEPCAASVGAHLRLAHRFQVLRRPAANRERHLGCRDPHGSHESLLVGGRLRRV